VIVAGRSGGEGVRIVLEAEEAMLLSELADQVDSVLLLGEADDPALDRLLPNAYPDDAASSREFARYTRDSLVDGKRQAAQRVRDATAVSLICATVDGDTSCQVPVTSHQPSSMPQPSVVTVVLLPPPPA